MGKYLSFIRAAATVQELARGNRLLMLIIRCLIYSKLMLIYSSCWRVSFIFRRTTLVFDKHILVMILLYSYLRLIKNAIVVCVNLLSPLREHN